MWCQQVSPLGSLRVISGALPLVLLSLISAQPLHGGLVAHWSFEEPSGSIAADSTGNHPGQLLNGTLFAPGEGISGGAIRLLGENHNLVDAGDLLGNPTDFSVQAWVKLNAGDTNPSMAVSKHLSGGWNGFFLYFNDPNESQTGKAGFYVSQHPGVPYSSTDVNDGAWHQIVGVYEGDTFNRIYVDGALEGAVPSAVFHPNNEPFLIGGLLTDGAYYFTGLIDEVQAYDHALSEHEVQYLFDHPGQAIPTAIAGDANGDFQVDLVDFAILKVNFGTGGSLAEGDFDGNGQVDLTDFGILKDNFGADRAAVPEPSGLLLALFAGGALATIGAARRRFRTPRTA